MASAKPSNDLFIMVLNNLLKQIANELLKGEPYVYILQNVEARRHQELGGN